MVQMLKKTVLFLCLVFFVLFGCVNTFDNDLAGQATGKINSTDPKENLEELTQPKRPEEPDDLFYNQKVNKELWEEPKFNGYIVRLKTPSISEEKISLGTTSTLSALNFHREKIINEQNEFKNKLKSLSPNIKIKREFQNVLNAISLDKEISPEKLSELENFSEVLRISKNFVVKALLSESVPLINADKVWKLNSSGKACGFTCVKTELQEANKGSKASSAFLAAEGGNVEACPAGYKKVQTECLTGKGVKIGIIDTGVDYTHESLGGCFFKIQTAEVSVKDKNNIILDQASGISPGQSIVDGGISEEINLVTGEILKFFTDSPSVENSVTSHEPAYGDNLFLETTSKAMSIQNILNNPVLPHEVFLLDQNIFIIEMDTNGTQTFGITAYINGEGPFDINDSSPFIDENPIDPAWIWKIEGPQTSVIIGVENNFLVDDFSDDPPGVGECFNFPNNYVSVCLDEQTTGTECKVEGGYDFVNNDSDPMDDHGHGTHAASIAAGNGTLKGVAPDATLVAYKVLDQDAEGNFDDVIAAIEQSVDPNGDGDFSDHLDIINISLGGFGDPDDDLSLAVDNAVNLGVVAVVAAGNSGILHPPNYPSTTECQSIPGGYFDSICSPGTARNAITVGATFKKDYSGELYELWGDPDPVKDQIMGLSSRGPVLWKDNQGIEHSLMKPDIVAPGSFICAAQGDDWLEGTSECDPEVNDHVSFSGTSVATPHVSGVAALLKQKSPYLDPLTIKSMLIINTEPVIGDLFTNLSIPTDDVGIVGHGRINAEKSINYDGSICTAKIINDQTEITSDTFVIEGTANCEDFTNYTLELGFGLHPQAWSTIKESETPVVDAVLGIIENVPNTDTYISIRLKVWNSSNKKFQDVAVKFINKISIISKKITTISSDKRYTDVYGDKIVWQDKRNGTWDIYMYDLVTQQEIPITTAVGDQEFPRIFESLIVWQDKRDNIDYDIYLYDLSTNTETPITTDSFDQFYPQIHENKIVWEDWSADIPPLPPQTRPDITLYDISLQQQFKISENLWWEERPDIYENKIVWGDYRVYYLLGDVYMYDLGPDGYFGTLDDSGEIPVDLSSVSDSTPRIDSHNVIWTHFIDDRDFDRQVFLYDLEDEQKYKLEQNAMSFILLHAPVIQNDKIVWGTDESYQDDLKMYGLGPDKKFGTLDDLGWVKITDDEPTQRYHSVYGNKVVAVLVSNVNDIYVYEVVPANE